MPDFDREALEELSTVIAHVLDGATHRPGAKHALAQQSGITPQHLSRIANGHNMPTVATARAIADALIARGFLDISAANAWFEMVREHAELSHRRTQAQRRRFRDDALAAAAELQKLEFAVNFVRDPAATQRALRDAVAQGALFLHIAPWLANQLEVAKTCMVLHHVYSSVGLQVQALRVAVHAVRALERIDEAERLDADAHARAGRRRTALERGDEHDRHGEPEFFDHLAVDARRAEAVALYNLHLPRIAYERSRAIEHHAAFKRYASYWKPHVYRDRLNAMAEIRRTPVSEAEGLVLQVRRILEARGRPDDVLLDSMICESLAKVYIARRTPAKARPILRAAQAQLRGSRLAGALHETLIVRSLADAAWHLGERDEWRELITTALHMAQNAGLAHQIKKIRDRYGAELEE